MSPDDWMNAAATVIASLSILGGHLTYRTNNSKAQKKEDAQFRKEMFLETQRIHSFFDEKRQADFDAQKERDSEVDDATDAIISGWFGKRYCDDSSDGFSRSQSGTKLVQESETVFKLEEDIQEFTACCSCPDCGQTAFHFINSSDQSSKIMRECISCKKVWLQLK